MIQIGNMIRVIQIRRPIFLEWTAYNWYAPTTAITTPQADSGAIIAIVLNTPPELKVSKGNNIHIPNNIDWTAVIVSTGMVSVVTIFHTIRFIIIKPILILSEYKFMSTIYPNVIFTRNIPVTNEVQRGILSRRLRV